MIVYITDYIKKPDIEKKILGKYLNLSNQNFEKIQILLVWHQKIDKKYLKNFPNVKYVIRYGVGYDDIDLNYLNKKKIIFSNTPDYGVDEVSDTALSMILASQRKIFIYDKLTRDLKKNTWQENILTNINSIKNTNLGIIGAGRIGSSLIKKAKALGFKIFFYDPYKVRGYEKIFDVNRIDDLEKIIKISDIISIHTDLNKSTKNMINKDFIKLMKKHSTLVNTSRGKIIENLDHFFYPLKNNHLSSLYLDVLPDEPPKNSILIDAWKNDEKWLKNRLVINPHSAYYSKDSFKEMRVKASTNALRFIKGQNPYNIIKK